MKKSTLTLITSTLPTKLGITASASPGCWTYSLIDPITPDEMVEKLSGMHSNPQALVDRHFEFNEENTIVIVRKSSRRSSGKRPVRKAAKPKFSRTAQPKSGLFRFHISVSESQLERATQASQTNAFLVDYYISPHKNSLGVVVVDAATVQPVLKTLEAAGIDVLSTTQI